MANACSSVDRKADPVADHIVDADVGSERHGSGVAGCLMQGLVRRPQLGSNSQGSIVEVEGRRKDGGA